MSLSRRELARVASDIRGHLLELARRRYREVQQKLDHLTDQAQRLAAIRRGLSTCDARRWHAAEEKLTRQIEQVSRDIPYYLGAVERALQACRLNVPSVAEIYQDLLQADAEFDGLRYDRKTHTLAVSTEPIGLDGVFLGDFAIQLHIPALAQMRPGGVYQVVALNAQPASSNPSVTHPHVQDGQLCPGDAGTAINSALAGGRICDFFMLIRSVLTTYNNSSPYVSLDNWYGIACYGCGYTTHPDGASPCYSCDNTFCNECSSYCRSCDDTTCSECLQNCKACEETVCPSCLTECPECGNPICKSCLDNLRCPCHEEEEDHEGEQDDPPAEAGTAADAAV